MILCSAQLQGQDLFEPVGTHPGAAAQSTVTGRKIATLFPWKGKLYAGYGDYGANTGPIDIYAYDPDSQNFRKEWQANTEAIYNFRGFNGRLFAPAIDRKSYATPGDYSMLDTNGVWGNFNFSSNSTHVYDVANLKDSDIYMVGSQDERATVWRSQNNGKTWKKIHSDTAVSGKAGDFARYYSAGVYRGKLYVQALDYYGSIHPYTDVWDGTKWQRDSSFSSIFGWRPDTLAGKMVQLSNVSGYSSLLRVFDGKKGSLLSNVWVFDFVIDSGYLYALVDSGYGTTLVKRTSDLVSWYTLARAPVGCRSLAIMNDKIYLGMNDSRIMRYTKSLSSMLTELPEWERSALIMFIFPNPCTDMLNIILPWEEETSVSACDLSGKVLINQKMHGSNEMLNVTSLPPGLYFLKLESKKGVSFRKFYKD